MKLCDTYTKHLKSDYVKIIINIGYVWKSPSWNWMTILFTALLKFLSLRPCPVLSWTLKDNLFNIDWLDTYKAHAANTGIYAALTNKLHSEVESSKFEKSDVLSSMITLAIRMIWIKPILCTDILLTSWELITRQASEWEVENRKKITFPDGRLFKDGYKLSLETRVALER